jgi:urease gamma subunit
VARRARKAGKRAASTVAKRRVEHGAKRVAEAVTSTAQKVAEAARGDGEARSPRRRLPRRP